MLRFLLRGAVMPPPGLYLVENSVLANMEYEMKSFEFDPLDKAIVAMLSEDGRMPIKEIADKLAVSAPTVRARLKALKEQEIITIGALIDPSKVEEVTSVHVGICLEKGYFSQGLKEIEGIQELNWIVIIAGRYDLIAQFTLTGGGIGGLYSLLWEKLNNIKWVRLAEPFVTISAINKRVFVPKEMRTKWLEQYAAQNSDAEYLPNLEGK